MKTRTHPFKLFFPTMKAYFMEETAMNWAGLLLDCVTCVQSTPHSPRVGIISVARDKALPHLNPSAAQGLASPLPPAGGPETPWEHDAAPAHHVNCGYGATDALGRDVRYLETI